MDQEQDLQKKLETFAELAKTNKGLDVGAMMTQAIAQQSQNFLSAKTKRWGYMVSLGLPPFGLLYAIYFYLSGKADGKKAAVMCAVLTATSFLIGYLTLQIFVSSVGVDLKQVESINPDQVKELLQ